MEMTLVELHNVLCERIKIAKNRDMPIEERAKEAEISMTISSLAKQVINNADVVLRADKLAAEGKLINSNIQKLVGRFEDNGGR